MPNKLTDTDVKKALECAIRNDCDCNCVFLLPNKVQDALDLINRLQAENETLRDVVKQNHLIRNNGKSPLSLIKSEAYKECLEKVKILNQNNLILWNEQLDNLLKEMVGENDA